MRYPVLLVLGLLAGCSGRAARQHDEIAGTPDLECSADSLTRTVVTSHLETPLGAGRNVLWCATFQLAWNELADLAGGEIRMADEDAAVAALNRRAVGRSDLDSRTYVALAGMVEDGVLTRAKDELRKTFGFAASPRLLPPPGSLPDGSFVAYSYLFADLPFAWSFERLAYPLQFGGTPVECFGIQQYLAQQENEAKAAGQLQVCDWRSNGDFIVSLMTQRKEHHLYLALVPPAPTLAQTIRAVQERIASGRREPLAECLDFRVPVLNFDVVREYGELTGRPLTVSTPRLNGQPIDIAKQQVRFRLDERGAVLKSEAIISRGLGMNNLVFDRPFLILLQYADARVPYFALWVDNAELLVPFSARPGGGNDRLPDVR